VLGLRLSEVAELFTVVSAGVLLLIVPSSMAALLIYDRKTVLIWLICRIPRCWEWISRHPAIQGFLEGDPKIRYVRRNANAYYWPSMFICRTLTLAFATGIVLIMAGWLVRVLARYEAIQAPGQASWSYVLSMIMTTVTVLLFWMPAVFLVWVKYQVLHTSQEDLERGRGR
jgi:hypothetical protein